MRLSIKEIVGVLFLLLSFASLAGQRCQTEDKTRVCTNSENQIVSVDKLGEEGRVIKRMLFMPQTKQLMRTIYPRYAERSLHSPDWPEAFRVEDAQGRVIRSFDNLNFENCQGARPRKHKLLVAEVFGIDLTHAALKNKIAAASIDDFVQTGTCHGFFISPQDELLAHAVGKDFHDGDFLDIDHGTMVSTVALEGIEDATLYPASGNLQSSTFYEHMSDVIQRNEVGLVNMSFSFTKIRSPNLNWRSNFGEAKLALTQLIIENPQALFVAASGNGQFGGFNYDAVNLTRSIHFPSGIGAENLFSVGAINSSEIEISKLSEYRMAKFSNYSIRHVDILAPGVGVETGRVGGGHAPASGTSFASPYIINQVMKLSSLAPHLNYIKIKELMMKTVYIPNIQKAVRYGMNWRESYTKEDLEKGEWFPVRSGGIYHPERAEKVAKTLAEDPSMSIDQVVEAELSAEEFLWRSRMWDRRGI
jgi:hypothetical protein